ncbi:MAG: hypothetical protein IKT38_04730 [Clostridia bacterium]|nr:hypothetical protein [Clostridia bacterium]
MYQLYFKFINETFMLETNSLNIFNILKIELWPSESINYVKKCKIVYVGSSFQFDNVYDNPIETIGTQNIVGFDRKEMCECLFINQASTIQPVRNFLASVVCSYYKENKNFFVLHASCVMKNKNAVLLLGKKHSGKTTLSLEMISNYEYKLVADDLSFIVLRGKKVYCYSLFKGIHLNDETFDYYSGFYSNIYNVDSEKTRYYVKKVKNKCIVTHIILSAVSEVLEKPFLEENNLKKQMNIINDNYINFTDDKRLTINKKLNNLLKKDIQVYNCCFGKDINISGIYLNDLLQK